jgi:hypothetical protein
LGSKGMTSGLEKTGRTGKKYFEFLRQKGNGQAELSLTGQSKPKQDES